MKKLVYFIQSGENTYRVVMDYNEKNEEIAKHEAYGGEYTIVEETEQHTGGES